MNRQPFFAVRITLTDVSSGSTATRDYVRGDKHIGKDAFASFALGDLLNLWAEPGAAVTFAINEVDFDTVRDNRRYHHTSHTEG